MSDLFYLAMVDADPESIMAELVSLIGQPAAIQIIDLFGGMTVKIPTKKKVAQAVKNASVWRDHTAGAALNDIADKHNISTTTALKIIERWSELHKAGKAAGYAD